MKLRYLLPVAVALTLGPVFAGGEGWVSHFEQAKTQAAEAKKDLLVDFTGSDWCGWCIKLNKEVFQHDAFKDGVKDSFVLVELDYPRDKSKLSEEIQTQNSTLQQTYGIKGFPTILLCDPQGRPFASTGYQAGGPEKYVAHLNELRGRRGARDEAFTKAEAATGVDQAKLLISALNAMELDEAMVEKTYPEIVEKIKTADPDDTTGFAKKQIARAHIAAFKQKLNTLMQAQDTEGALAYMDEVLGEEHWPLDFKQDVHGHRASVQLRAKDQDGALKTLEAGIALAPDSETSAKLKEFKEFIQKQKENPEGAKKEEGADKKPAAADSKK